jgi:putative ABC transport system substrate-binding protein
LEVSREANPEYHEGFLQGMRELGYIEGKDFVTDHGDANGRLTALADRAAELVRRRADMILLSAERSFREARAASPTIPILMMGIVDPIGGGFITSLARPGGNVTGLATSSDDTTPKQLELLGEIIPKRSRIAFLRNPDITYSAAVARIVQDAGEKAGLPIVHLEARSLPDIEAAFVRMAKEDIRAILIPPAALFSQHRLRIVELALSQRLPTMFAIREMVTAGGLMSYGQSRREFYRQGATFVHKIMRGAKPGDLPVEQPTRFHLTINRKTADALGVTIPPILYIFADEVIE